MDCSVAQCLEVVGEWWSMLIVRDAFFGVRRFDDFQNSLGISRNILNQRLTRLVDEGVLQRVRYQEHPPRDEYRLTDKGLDLYPLLVALMAWGDQYAVGPEGPPVLLRHRDCGEPVELHLSCRAGHSLDSAREVTPVPGRGARKIA